MDKIINLSDMHTAEDKINVYKYLSNKGAPKKTRITISNPVTKEVYGTYENKVVISGAMYTACQLFNIVEPTIIPNYNTELGLENSEAAGTIHPGVPELVALFAVGDSGCGSVESDVKVARFIDRISPKMTSGVYDDIIPFRYVDSEHDRDIDREMYFGRKVIGSGANERIAYFFKKFETEPQIFLKYADGTDITSQLYDITTDQDANCYVEMELLVGSLDLRDYFNEVKGWGNARISTVSLCSGWVKKFGNYDYYQNILPYTKLNFPFIRLIEAEQAVQFNYAIFY